MEKKKVAIIVPFTSLDNYVLECINGCLNINYSSFILVLLPDKHIELPPTLNDKRIRVEKTGDVTIAKKRNLGIKKNLDIDYYAFIDSDAYPNKNWLKNSMKAFSQDPQIGAVGGPNISPPNENIYKKVVGNALKSLLLSGTRSYRKKIKKSRTCIDLPTCNLVIKKELIDSIGFFNEKLITGEDIEFCNRIVKDGKKILYNNEVIVYHHNRSLFKPFILQRIAYGFSVFRILKEQFCLSNIFLLIPLMFTVFLIFGVMISFFNRIILEILVVIITLYLTVISIETIRCSSKISETPLTFLAILLGNLTPGIGSLLSLFNVKINIKKFCRNNE